MSTNFIADAVEPKRSSGTITLSWGLLNIPLSVFSGTEETSIGRKEFVDGDVELPAGRAIISKVTGEVVERDRIVRMAEASSGVFVELSDDEIASCTGNRNVAEVVTFIRNDDIFRYMPTRLMQARPHRTKGIPDPAAAKAFSLLISAMASTSVSALVKVAMRGPAQYAILTATGDLLFVCYSDGVRKPLPMGLVAVTGDEQAAAQNLIDAIGIGQAPHVPNVTAQAIGQYVDSKVAGGAIPSALPRPPTTQVDLMAQLTKSIEEKKNAPKWGAPTGLPENTAEPVKS